MVWLRISATALERWEASDRFVRAPEVFVESLVSGTPPPGAIRGAAWLALYRHSSDEAWDRARRRFLARVVSLLNVGDLPRVDGTPMRKEALEICGELARRFPGVVRYQDRLRALGRSGLAGTSGAEPSKNEKPPPHDAVIRQNGESESARSPFPLDPHPPPA